MKSRTVCDINSLVSTLRMNCILHAQYVVIETDEISFVTIVADVSNDFDKN